MVIITKTLPSHKVIRCYWKIRADGLSQPRIATNLVKWSESHSVMFNSLQPHGLYSPWNSPGQNTGVGGHSLLQGNLPKPGIKPRFPWVLHYRWILYHLSHKGSSVANKHHIKYDKSPNGKYQHSFYFFLFFSKSNVIIQRKIILRSPQL